jgi:tight adherence protein C
METVILAFSIVFVALAGAGILLFNRGTMHKQLSTAINPSAKKDGMFATMQQSGISVSSLVKQFERVLPRSQKETGIVQQRLIRAGYRNDTAVKIFYGTKVLVPLALVVLVIVSGLANDGGVMLYIGALGVGFLAPDFWLGRQIKVRQAKLRRSLPDVLDLLVVCIEAGLSLDQATIRTTQELNFAHPAISDELGIVVLEQRAGRPRTEAWKHLAERTDVDNVRNLVTVLIQSEQFGTSIAKTLRTHSDTLRTQRIQKVEEMAAKTTVKLIFPLVLFIFPSLFVVVLGPAFIMMSESFKEFFNH